MKKLIAASTLFIGTCAFAGVATAADAMAGMKMESGAMSAPASNSAALTDAVVRKVDPASGMVTLKHGALTNVGMAECAKLCFRRALNFRSNINSEIIDST